jgi:hypothetical protein
MTTRKHNITILATVFTLALFILGMGVQQAAAAPDLSAPGSFYVDLDNGGNNDGPANGWLWSSAPGFIYENDNYMRYSEADGDTEFKMTVTGLTTGTQYDVAVLFGDQWDAGFQASWKAIQAGLVSGSLTELSMVNDVEAGIGGNATSTEFDGTTWYHVQSNPGVVGAGPADGAGELDIFFAGTVAMWVWAPVHANPASQNCFSNSADRPHNSRLMFEAYGLTREGVIQNCGFSGAPQAAFVFHNHFDEGLFRGALVEYQWTHLAMVWREDQTGEDYIDGVSVADICNDEHMMYWPEIPYQCLPRAPDWVGWPAPAQCPPPVNAAEFQKNVRIGNFIRVQDGAMWNHWLGRIDDVRVYSRALTAGEINALGN